MILRETARQLRLSTLSLAATAWLGLGVWLGTAGLAPSVATAFDGPKPPAPSLDAELLEQLTEGLGTDESEKPDDAKKTNETKPAEDAKPDETQQPGEAKQPNPAKTKAEEAERTDGFLKLGGGTDDPAGEPGPSGKKLVEPSRAASDDPTLDEKLLDELKEETSPSAEQDAVAMIRERMEEARRRIDAAESGEEVQSLQKQIVDDLAKLLQMKQCQCQSQCQNPSSSSKPSNSSKPGSKPGESPSKKPGEKKSDDAEKKPGEQPDDQGEGENKKPKDSDKSLREMKTADAMAFDQLADFLQAEWGHLPERERNQVIQAFKEKFLPEYDQMIRDYYERLAVGREESR